MTTPDEYFAWTRRIPAAWQESVARLSVGENVSRLWLAWLPGTPYAPIQRYAVYEVLPESMVGAILAREELMGHRDSLMAGRWGTRCGVRGPDPATIGQWVRDPAVPMSYNNGKRWRSTSMVSRTQWLIHREIGGLPLLFWIIEGDRGGHMWHMGEFERAFLLSTGLAPDAADALAEAWPAPGEQPYAEYDNRVFHALAERDRLAQWTQSKPWDQRVRGDVAPDLVIKEHADRAREMRERIMKYIDNQIGDFVSDLPRATLARLPKAEFGNDLDDEGSAQQFVEGS